MPEEKRIIDGIELDESEEITEDTIENLSNNKGDEE